MKTSDMNWLFAIFLFSAFMVFYAYFGYPLSVLLLGIFQKNVEIRQPLDVPVTLIITVYNEEKRIKEKLENTLKLNYPAGKLQIIVASDGSTDATNDIVRAYEKQGIELLKVINRGGKENAQKEAVIHARGDLIIFSDVATILEP